MAEREKSIGKEASWSNLLNLNEHESQESDVLELFFDIPHAGRLSISLIFLQPKQTCVWMGK